MITVGEGWGRDDEEASGSMLRIKAAVTADDTNIVHAWNMHFAAVSSH